jgi:hypothetical protein
MAIFVKPAVAITSADIATMLTRLELNNFIRRANINS